MIVYTFFMCALQCIPEIYVKTFLCIYSLAYLGICKSEKTREKEESVFNYDPFLALTGISSEFCGFDSVFFCYFLM